MEWTNVVMKCQKCQTDAMDIHMDIYISVFN